tara:strand:+ start:370 stop:492 length:123 start_codon:yes stop_codon:yes gene_type:complete
LRNTNDEEFDKIIVKNMDFKGFDRDLEDFDKINSLIEKYK